MLPSSQSDDAIYARSIQNQDELDATDYSQWVPRSSSLNAIVSMQVEFSEDDEQLFERRLEDDFIDAEETGAARIRDPPTRKTKIKESKGKTSKRPKAANNLKTTSAGIRGRRKLREATPDLDVDVE